MREKGGGGGGKGSLEGIVCGQIEALTMCCWSVRSSREGGAKAGIGVGKGTDSSRV